MGKNSKGSVAVRSLDGRLRLVWSHCGKRYYLAVGLDDTPENRTIAEYKAKTIERDLLLDNFDSTLNRYRPQVIDGLTALDLFDRWIAMKRRSVDGKTIEKYQALKSKLTNLLKGRNAELLPRDCDRVLRQLSNELQPITLLDRLSILRACWKWGMSQGFVKENAWSEVKIKVPPKQSPKPFSDSEITRIRDAFKNSAYYSYYSDYVDFLFGTGCRTGEAVGLLWRHVADDFSSVWIGEILTKGKRKAEKRNKGRIVPLTPFLQAMLKRKAENGKAPDQLVFTAAEGGAIDANNFRNRAWKPILESLGIDYRKPYTTRSTLISHALDQGMNPVEISELVGNRIETLHRHYAGVVRRPKLPDLLD